jgi:uncharacterized membrane protein YdjX (TVP38/TMEM64 family)
VTRSRARTVARVLVAALAAATVTVGLATDLGPSAGDVDRWLSDSGPWGPLAFVASMWLIQPLGVPGVMWMVPAGLIWAWPVAAALSWIGNMGASTIGFGFARWAGREWVARRLPPRLRALDTRLADRGLAPVVGLRVVTGQLAPADWFLGVSSVRWSTFLVGTGIGIVPGILLAVVAGGGVVEWVGAQDPLVWGLAAVAVLLGVAAVWVVRRRMDESAPRPTTTNWPGELEPELQDPGPVRRGDG